MTAVFRDSLGTFALESVENMQFDASKNTWLVMFDDYETQEIKAQLIEINQD